MLGYSSDASRDMLARSELEALQVRPIATHETPILLLLELELLEVYYRKIGGGPTIGTSYKISHDYVHFTQDDIADTRWGAAACPADWHACHVRAPDQLVGNEPNDPRDRHARQRRDRAQHLPPRPAAAAADRAGRRRGRAPAVGWTAGEPDVRRELKLPPAEAAVLSNGACGLQHT